MLFPFLRNERRGYDLHFLLCDIRPVLFTKACGRYPLEPLLPGLFRELLVELVLKGADV